MPRGTMISKLSNTDFQAILGVVNEAAVAYRGRIPPDCCKEPYMPAKELKEEIASGVQFYGYFENGVLAAVMGIQKVQDVTLMRHAYVLSSMQRRGLGEKLLSHLKALADTKTVLVGTWQAATWAVGFYEKNGFKLVTPKQKDKLLKKYWNIPPRQIETSVVLKLKENPLS
jgi:GNAT superfamily N-acetyltransferase